MRRYPKYKDSGVEWLGEIPEQWSFEKLKFLTKHISIATYQKEDDDVYIALENIESWTGKIILNEEFSGFDSTVKKFSEKDILFGKLRPYLAKVVMPDFKGVCVSELIVLRPIKVIREYLFFILLNPNFIDFVSQTAEGTKMPRTSWNRIGDLKFSLPPLPEQHSIVQFLDHKTDRIDRFIANRKNQIELLKEQFKKKIFTALTRGLSNNIFKPTDLPWFPEIPKDWDLYKFNAAIKLHHGFQFRDNHFREAGVKVVKITQLKADGTLDLSEASFVEEKFLTTLKDRIIKRGDILMALTGGTIGKIICVEDIQEEVLQNYRVGKFVPKDSKILDKDFMFWVLSSDFTFAQILFLQRETGQPNIGISDFSKMFFPLPNTIEEQREISVYINEQKIETDALISKYQKQIDLMQEYRTALISQAVTGKIKVV